MCLSSSLGFKHFTLAGVPFVQLFWMAVGKHIALGLAQWDIREAFRPSAKASQLITSGSMLPSKAKKLRGSLRPKTAQLSSVEAEAVACDPEPLVEVLTLC